MTKAKAFAILKQRLSERNSTDGIIPVSKQDIQEEVEMLDSFHAHQSNKKTSRNALTSDEG